MTVPGARLPVGLRPHPAPRAGSWHELPRPAGGGVAACWGYTAPCAGPSCRSRVPPTPFPPRRGGWGGRFLARGSPWGRASGLHIWSPAAGPGTGGCPRPPPAPASILGRGREGAPDGANPPPPSPTAGGQPRGGVWRGHFPALTDGAAAAGIRAPRGLDLARREGSTDGLGAGGLGGGPMGCRGCVTAVPQPCLTPHPFLLQRRRLQVPRGPAAPGLRQGEPGAAGTGPGHPAGKETSPMSPPRVSAPSPRLARPRCLARVPVRKQEPFVPPRWETETHGQQRALVRVPAGGSGPGHRAHSSPLGFGGGEKGAGGGC